LAGDTQHAQIVVNVGTSTSTVVNSENIPTATHVGNSSDDVLVGSNGNDYMIGGDGNDNLSGLLGNDALFGGWGNDTLVGGDGNNTLTGGHGNDVLTGGIGSDVFAWTFNDGGAHGTPAVDTITDFDTRPPAAGGDIIDLRDLLAGEKTSTLENYLEFTFSGSGSTATTTIRRQLERGLHRWHLQRGCGRPGHRAGGCRPAGLAGTGRHGHGRRHHQQDAHAGQTDRRSLMNA